MNAIQKYFGLQPSKLNSSHNLTFINRHYLAAREEINKLIENNPETTTLDLRKYPGLKRLPPNIYKLKNLKSLNLSGCVLRSLPERIGELSNLESLDVSNTMINTLPISIGQLSNLKRLNCSDNSMRSLPASLKIVGYLAFGWYGLHN